MSDEFIQNRRAFIGNVVKGTLGGAVAAWGGMRADAQGVAPPRNVRVVTDPSSKRLITPSDLTWLGMAKWVSEGQSFLSAHGGTPYNEHGFAVRYVSGQRRILLPWWRSSGMDSSGVGNHVGQLTEYTIPELYTGSSVSSANTMAPTGRVWQNWHINDQCLPPANGVNLSSLWWDEANQGVWYNLYPYYDNTSQPFLGFTHLDDDGTCVKYGMWYYRDKVNDGWKTVSGHFVPIPAWARVGNLVGKTMGISGALLSVTGSQHYGPGLHAFDGFPPLTHRPGTVIPLGVRLMDYTRGSPSYSIADAGQPHRCRRSADYTSLGGSVPVVKNGIGRWLGSDQHKTMIWVEGTNKHGILCFGKRQLGNNWYGEGASITANGVTYTDPYWNDKGYHGDKWQAALWVISPDHVKEVALGTRSPWSDAVSPWATWMEPAALYNWADLWPNIPKANGAGNYPGAAWVASDHPFCTAGGWGGGFYDEAAKQILWLHWRTYINGYDPLPTLQVFRFVDA
jgi:hypothetical protein